MMWRELLAKLEDREAGLEMDIMHPVFDYDTRVRFTYELDRVKRQIQEVKQRIREEENQDGPPASAGD